MFLGTPISLNKCLPLILLSISEAAFFSKGIRCPIDAPQDILLWFQPFSIQIWPSYLSKGALQTYQGFNLLMNVFQD